MAGGRLPGGRSRAGPWGSVGWHEDIAAHESGDLGRRCRHSARRRPTKREPDGGTHAATGVALRDCRGVPARGWHLRRRVGHRHVHVTTFRPTTTYTVPAGWANTLDLPGNFLLARVAEPVVDFYGGNAIIVMPDVAASARDCGEAAQPGVGRTADHITRWLARRPGLTVSPRVPATAGGLSGYAVDIRLADGWTGYCPFADDPVVPLTVSGDPAQFHPTRTIAARGTSQRAYVLDGPPKATSSSSFSTSPVTSGSRTTWRSHPRHRIPALRRLTENPVKTTALVSLAQRRQRPGPADRRGRRARPARRHRARQRCPHLRRYSWYSPRHIVLTESGTPCWCCARSSTSAARRRRRPWRRTMR